MNIKIVPNTLRGSVSVPASKSLSHRAIIAASLASEKSTLHNVVLSSDIEATLACMQSLGAKFELIENTLYVHGFSGGDHFCKVHFNCKESGSTLRFLIPIALIENGEYHFEGESRLVSRPQGEYHKIFDMQGIVYEKVSSPLELPLRVKGSLKGGVYHVRGDVSSQFITGLLFALPLTMQSSEIRVTTKLESKGYVDLTLDVLKHFGIDVQENAGVYHIKGNQRYNAQEYWIEGDYSQVAFWLVAGCLSRNSKIICKGMYLGSKQGDSQILSILKEHGADIKEYDESIESFSSQIDGFEVDLSQIPDLGPILTVLACFAKGKSRLYNGTRLRIKESDRVTSMVTELSKMGAIIQEIGDEIHVEGQEFLEGGVTLSSWGDHRVAMALSIAAIRCKKSVVLTGAECVSKSYLKFWDDYKALGGVIDEL